MALEDLDSRLLADCQVLGRLRLCWLLMMRDANYPWFILVPDRPGITEIFQLCEADQLELIRESSRLAGALSRAFTPDKINVAALGNVVAQLHVHHIVRYRDDPAWPAPVWGRVEPTPYTNDQARLTVARLKQELRDAVEWHD